MDLCFLFLTTTILENGIVGAILTKEVFSSADHIAMVERVDSYFYAVYSGLWILLTIIFLVKTSQMQQKIKLLPPPVGEVKKEV